MNHPSVVDRPLRLLEGLNPEQLAAVTAADEHALILAGAGSGKTRVLTTRIAWLIQTGQLSPGGVMAVTFTNKAAKEMLTRLAAMLPINVRGMWIGTFHGLCNRFLRAHWKLSGLPQSFQILDSGDQQSAVKRVISSTALRELMKQMVRASAFTRSARSSDASPSADARVPSASSSSGGFHIAIRRRACGAPSRSIRRKSSRPVRRSASSTGLAIVAEASRKRGAVP